MKEIRAQLSSDILQNILPLSAIDTTRDVLTPLEANALFNLWKNAEKSKGRPTIPFEMDRTLVSSLRYKGYIERDGQLIDFTKRGKEAIKHIILSKEENTFEKKAKK